MFNFLKLEENAFGLNISDLSCKIVQLEKAGGRFRLVSWGKADIRPGVIEDGEIEDGDELSNVIRGLIKNAKGKKIKTRDAIVSLPEKKTFLERMKLPKMGEKELKSAVTFQAENYIPMPMSEVSLDFHVLKPVSGEADNVDVLLTAFPKKIINQYLATIKAAGVRPTVLEPESWAITRAIANKDDADRSLFIVNIEENSALFAVNSGRLLSFSSSMPVSSEAIGQPNLEELSVHIKKYVNYYKTYISPELASKRKKSKTELEKIILCGKIVGVEEAAKNLSSLLQMTVEAADIGKNIFSKTVKKTSLVSRDELLEYAIALGLAMRNFEKK